ncbi:hypothetical protein [Cupriavidus necator]
MRWSTDGRGAGALICGATADIDRDSLDLAPYLAPQMIEALAAPITSLDIPSGFFLHSLAVYPQLRGQGLGANCSRQRKGWPKRRVPPG